MELRPRLLDKLLYVHLGFILLDLGTPSEPCWEAEPFNMFVQGGWNRYKFASNHMAIMPLSKKAYLLVIPWHNIPYLSGLICWFFHGHNVPCIRRLIYLLLHGNDVPCQEGLFVGYFVAIMFPI